ncbi:hypothetical protein [Chromobacterium phragmitis]|uniref:Uncharacterized protein n=1 Tax=Chromobacterium phragmitis TaxID=2202141 RepID=A0A344UPH3_9NEIS|nr:hypothetical protein [Chromobacterium phragmitis]AXE37171.1 hypothetical protein DK843_22750 [Chromobacterium phragmitis]
MNLNPIGDKAEALEKGREWSTQAQETHTSTIALPWQMPYANERIQKSINVRLNEPLLAKLDVLIAIGVIKSKLSYCANLIEEDSSRLIEENWERVLAHIKANPPKVSE